MFIRRSSNSRKPIACAPYKPRAGARSASGRPPCHPRSRRNKEVRSCAMSADLEHLEVDLGHHFQNREIFVRALTHSSRVHERAADQPDSSAGPHTDNEQMEFLGDAVLGFLAAESMVQRFPSYPEGRLSKLKAHLVSAAHLYEVDRK